MYKEIIKKICINNKYTKWYIELCDRASNRIDAKNLSKRKEANKILGYAEGHHILPRSLCQSDAQIKDKNNIVYLTYREHLIAHALLCRMFEKQTIEKHKMQYACIAFNKSKNSTQASLMKENFRTLENIKKEYSKRRSEMSKGENNINYGGVYTSNPIVREKMIKSAGKRDNTNIGKYARTHEFIEKFRKSRVGKGTGERNSMSNEENRLKVSNSKIGRKIAINKETGQRKYVYPDNVPDGFVLKNG